MPGPLASGRLLTCLARPAGVAWGGLAGSHGAVTIPEGDALPFREAMRSNSAVAPVPRGAEDAVRVDSFRHARLIGALLTWVQQQLGWRLRPGLHAPCSG